MALWHIPFGKEKLNEKRKMMKKTRNERERERERDKWKQTKTEKKKKRSEYMRRF